jgi:hypothetical protein
MSGSEPAAPQVPPAAALSAWSPGLRIAFRFVCSYLPLSAYLGPLSFLPGTGGATRIYLYFWQAVLPWVAKHLLHLHRPLDLLQDGGGDNTASFVKLLSMGILAAVATLVWTLLDRKRGDYRRLHAALRLYVRYLLGFVMFNYGMIKVIQTQFLPLSAWRLEEQYGDLSPMGLLWTFMSYSVPYNVFTGGAEALGGLLLLFRRTTTLGALLTVAVLSHVVLINFSYDVIVKLYSSNLLFLGLFLLAPDLSRLADLLVLNRPTTPPPPLPRAFDQGWQRALRRGLKLLLIGYVLFTLTEERWPIRKRTLEWRAKQLAGPSKTYGVDEMIRNGRTIPLPSPTPVLAFVPPPPPLLSLAAPAGVDRWRSITFGPRGWTVTLPDLEDREFATDYDAAKATYVVWSKDRRTKLGRFTCSRPDGDHLVIEGTLGNDTIALSLHRLDLSRYPLLRRDVHGINEKPFDR